MTLDELIAQITNPQEFTRLCNSVFTEVYGQNFQIIDGTRGDNGNEGYVVNERRILAIHCPIKPEQKTDAGYLTKIRSDLQKASALKDKNKYDIESWTFITPRKLSDDVISAMKEIGAKLGINASHQESTYLAGQLQKHDHLMKGFPSLQQIDLNRKLDQLISMYSDEKLHKSANATVSPANKYESLNRDEAGEAKLAELIAGTPTPQKKSELKSLIYRTIDPILEINAILSMFRWLDPIDDDRSDLMSLADRGITKARQLNLSDIEGVFHAHKSAFFPWDFNILLIETHFSAAMDLILPLGMTPNDQNKVNRLIKLETGWKDEAAIAIEKITDSVDHDAIASVLLIIGPACGQISQVLKAIGEQEKSDSYLSQCKNFLLAAKDVYADAGDELGAANAIFNLANQIRFHGGENEAKELVSSTINTAEKYKDALLLQKANWLKSTLDTGVVPDYQGGERRQ